MRLDRHSWFLFFVLVRMASVPTVCVATEEIPGDVPTKELPLPGEVFAVSERTAFLISSPGATGDGKPWVWYAPTLPGLPGPEERWMFEAFLAEGIAIAGIDVGESFGSPAGRSLYSAFHHEMTGVRSFARRAVLLGRSRGGLMTLSWAADHPESVAAFAGIYPVCSIASYPGIARAASAYELSAAELERRIAEHDPVDRLAALARAGVPLFAIHGDVDTVVPLEANSGLVQERYRELGGDMHLIVPPGQGHNMWPGFFECRELVEFVVLHSRSRLSVTSPRELEVVQRSRRTGGSITIEGTISGPRPPSTFIEARTVDGDAEHAWVRIDAEWKGGTFRAVLEASAGGWFRLDVRAVRELAGESEVLARTAVERVGVGEVFVVAGQSNSANHGEERQRPRSGRVVTFDGGSWRIADDPQPGASGGGGSFLPSFGDAMVEALDVPVGLVACGVGATSVREWLPEGATFPNPPTIEGHVRRRDDGTWESRGAIFASFLARMKTLGPGGFRAVLWHQGESDANQADPTRTLAGLLYRQYLEALIRESRREIGKEAPWFVAQVSYHQPDDAASPEIRAAQASLWKDGIALEGPDSDALGAKYRDGDGRGVHFSAEGLREHGRRWALKVAPWVKAQLE